MLICSFHKQDFYHMCVYSIWHNFFFLPSSMLLGTSAAGCCSLTVQSPLPIENPFGLSLFMLIWWPQPFNFAVKKLQSTGWSTACPLLLLLLAWSFWLCAWARCIAFNVTCSCNKGVNKCRHDDKGSISVFLSLSLPESLATQNGLGIKAHKHN
jgi:hypothetical protein